MKKFIMDRLNERTTLDGAVLIGAGVAFLIFKPIASLVALWCNCIRRLDTIQKRKVIIIY